MANWTKAELANNALEYMGVKAAGQSVSGEHSNYVQKVIDSLWKQYRPTGLMQYATSAIPDWSHMPWMKLLAFEVGPRFGRPYPESYKNNAIREMAAYVFGGPKSHLPIESEEM